MKLRPHGTEAAYSLHYKRGEKPCEECRTARNRRRLKDPIRARRRSLTPKERFFEDVVMNDGCWGWIGPSHRLGYGRLSINRKTVWAHRYSYELFVGPIPAGMEIDHLCRTPACTNPDHLEPVTHLENMRRGAWATATHCKHGHPFDEQNTRIDKTGRRDCRACNRRDSIEKRNRVAS